MPTGRLFAYNGHVSIEEHLSGRKPVLLIPNLMPTVGRLYVLDSGLTGIDSIALGNNGAARSLADIDLKNNLFSASPTDSYTSGTKRVVQLFVGISEANFTHREFGVFAGATLLSTLVISPEWEKTTSKTRTYIWESGWF